MKCLKFEEFCEVNLLFLYFSNSIQCYIKGCRFKKKTAIATEGESALNQALRGRPRSNTSVRLSHLGCLSYLAWFACSPSMSFPCITPLCAHCSAVQFSTWYVYRQYDQVSTGTHSQFYGPGNGIAMGTRCNS